MVFTMVLAAHTAHSIMRLMASMMLSKASRIRCTASGLSFMLLAASATRSTASSVALG